MLKTKNFFLKISNTVSNHKLFQINMQTLPKRETRVNLFIKGEIYFPLEMWHEMRGVRVHFNILIRPE